MSQPDRQPITPEKQLTSPRNDMDNIDCTPNTKNKMLSLKRKASDLLESGSPTSTGPFLKWRLAVVSSLLEVTESQKQALSEASNSFHEANITSIKEEERALLQEKAFILAHRQTLAEDLNDSVTSKTQLQDAYITELRMSLEVASTHKEKLPGLKVPRTDRNKFQNLVNDYLGSKVVYETGDTKRWCNILGHWLGASDIKCAHIVPYSWNTKEMAHTFGADGPPLTSRRNGLSMQKKIEEAFDNCWIVIVPFNTVESVPTEWKVVLLNTAEKDNTFFTDALNITGQTLWRWRDIDGRKLSFRNDNRPTRRFLYMRYALAWLHAEDKSWSGFKAKVPPGEVWASPNKPDGYLRKSILLELGKKTGDRLPKDLVGAGIFEDPDTSSVVLDEVASIRVTEHVQDHLDGVRDTKMDEEGSKGAGMEGEADMEDEQIQ